MQGEINVRYIVANDKRHAAIFARIRTQRPPDEERLKHNRKINGRTQGVIWRYQHHQITQAEAKQQIHDLEHQLK